MRNYHIPASYNTLNADQKLAFDMLKYGYDSGKNYLITGNAGTGKSYLIDAYTEFCEMNNITIVKTAPTGLAATTIGGVTLNKMFMLPPTICEDRISGTQYSNIERKLIYADVIVIDEISMVRIDAFNSVMRQIKKVNDYRARRYGTSKNPVQIILCGDFGQLPPIIKDEDKKLYTELYNKDIQDGFCYNSSYWTDFDITPILLTDSMRQKDPAFCKALDNIKIGISKDIDYINQNSAKQPIKDAIWLCGTNKTAKILNDGFIAQIPNPVFKTSTAKTEGRANVKQTAFEEILTFTVGARVLMVMKDTAAHHSRWQNGQLGTITAIHHDSVDIRFDGTYSPVNVEPAEVPFIEYTVDGDHLTPTEIGSVTQYPFKIGYAITIHKSQGQTYDKVNLVPEIFQDGQLYVALSRCRELDNIFIAFDKNGNKLIPDQVRTAKDIIKFALKVDAEYYEFKDFYLNTVR